VMDIDFFFSRRRGHTRLVSDWSSDVCSSDLTAGMAQFLARSGHAKNNNLWAVAQAVSEILPDGNKEKQLMQGLLNQREQLAELRSEERRVGKECRARWSGYI